MRPYAGYPYDEVEVVSKLRPMENPMRKKTMEDGSHERVRDKCVADHVA